MNTKNPHVDIYFSKIKDWKAELELLRYIAIACGLDEELKWGSPCYSYKKHNVAIIGGLKNSCVLSFFKGALLKDEHQLLKEPGPNTQAARTIKFQHISEIHELSSIIKAYFFEAIEIEKAGLKVEFKEKTELIFPAELDEIFAKNKEFETAFYQLSPGRQRAYNLHFSAPKQSKTIVARIEKAIPQIMQGKGLHD